MSRHSAAIPHSSTFFPPFPVRFSFAVLSLAALPSLALAQGKFVNITAAELACISNCTQTIAPNDTREIATCKNQTIFDDPECFCNSQKYLYDLGNCVIDSCPATNATQKLIEQCNPFRENGAVLNAPDLKLISFLTGAGVVLASALLA